MASKELTPELLAELQSLALLSDESIDTADFPEVKDWSHAKRGLFANTYIKKKNYDVRALANWFIERGSQESRIYTNMSLNKLVYLAFERMLVERSTLLSTARVEAWSHGPVFREIYQAFKIFDDKPVTQFAQRFSTSARAMLPAQDIISPIDEQFLESIFERFGHMTAGQLRAISHLPGGPWDHVWHDGGSTNPGMEITPVIIFNFAPELRDVNEQNR